MSEITQFEKENDEIEIDLGELFHLLLEKLWVLIICLVAGAVIAGSVTKFAITPQYSASSMLFILTKTTSVTSLADIQMGAQLTVDFETLAKSRPTVETVIEKLDLDMSYEELVKMITTENPADTRILKLIVTHPDAKLAKDISNALSDATADQVADVMDTDKPRIAERAVTPKVPSSPSLLKNTAIGAMIGLFLAAAVIILRYLMNDTIQTEEDVRKYLGLHTLAAMPMEKKR